MVGTKERKKIVVFGGAGYLGSHVADAFSNKGYQVSIFDRVPSKFLMESQNMVVGDIMELPDVMEAVNNADFVYHFAGIADIKEANENPLETVKYNILGTTNILEACVRAKVERIIYASTVYVYSELGGFYRSSKQASELLIENYMNIYGLDFTILRFGSIYGRRANKFNWIHNIITQALSEGKMQRKGNGEDVRDYIHVSDAANACVDILNDEFKNEYIMLTGAKTIKVNELLALIKEMLDNKPEIEYLDEVENEGHYKITPYSFRPRVAKKYVRNTQIDLGQGIMGMLSSELFKSL